MQKIISLLCVIILLISCNSNNPVATMNAKDCSIESVESAFYVRELILFSNDESINKKQILLPDGQKLSNKINFCSILESHNINVKDVNLIAVSLRNSKNDMEHFVINSDQLSLLGKDTSISFSEPVQ